MYSNGHQPPAASGQQSAFSHPPHLLSSSSSRSPSNARQHSQYSAQHSGQVRRGSGVAGTWSPADNSSAAGAEDDEDDDDDDDDDDDEDEEEDEEDEEEKSGPTGKKRKRTADMDEAGKITKTGKGGKGSGDGNGEEASADGKKPKPTRGAKACKNCRRLKMRCVGAESGPPCDRCKHTNHACIFEESNRGKRSGKNQKQEAMAASLRKMEATMNNLIQSLRDPSSAFSQGAGMLTRSPSPNTGPNGSYAKTDRHFEDRAKYTSQTQDRERMERGWPAVSEVDELGRAYGALREGKGGGDAAPSTDEATAQGAFIGQSLRETGPLAAAASPGGRHIDPKALNQAGTGVHRSASPSTLRQQTTRFVEPERPSRTVRHTSPRLHSLPDNTLNPLGLLAEASLHNSQRARRLSSRHRTGPDDTARIALRATAGSIAGSASSPGGSVSNHSLTGTAAGASDSPATSVKVELPAEDGSSPSKDKKALVEKGGEKATTVEDVEDSLPGKKNVKDGAAGTLSAAVASGTPGGMADLTERYHLGVASESYFKPGPMTILPLRRIVIERELAPELLTQGIITSEEVLELFQIYFHNCSQHVHLLDPEWHTPTTICGRSPFLFTVVCTIAAKFYTKRPDLHLKCLQMVRKSAYLIMSRGFKSVEIVQGFMLLTLWNTPAERFEEDKTWLFSGVAIRMATDLNLHRKSVASLPGHHQPNDPIVLEREREIINRERTWLVCFSIDRSISGQMGKPWTIREDWIIRNSRHWCMQRLSHPWDLGICGMVELLRLSSRQLDSLYSSTSSISGLNTDIDHSMVMHVFNEQLEEWHETWKARGFFTSPHDREDQPANASGVTTEEQQVAEALRSANTETAPADDEDYHRRTLHFLTKQAPLRYNYAVLILNSFGLQHAVDFPLRSGLDKGLYFAKCLQAAKNIVFAARDGLKPILAYSPDTVFVIISYACVFLLKLTRPTFAAFVDEDNVVAIVTEGAELLESVAMNPTHTPALYASFLRALLQSRLDRTATNRSGATTPHRSRAASPLDGQASGDLDAPAPDGFGDQNRADEDNAPSLQSGAMPASIFTSLGGSLGGNNGTSLTAEQAALLRGYMDGSGGSAGAGGMASGGQTPAGAFAVDQLLNESFWGSLLPPGFGGPLDGLATGSVEMYPTGTSHANLSHYTGTASAAHSNNQTRASTPSMLNTFGPNVSFDFSAGSLS